MHNCLALTGLSRGGAQVAVAAFGEFTSDGVQVVSHSCSFSFSREEVLENEIENKNELLCLRPPSVSLRAVQSFLNFFARLKIIGNLNYP